MSSVSLSSSLWRPFARVSHAVVVGSDRVVALIVVVGRFVCLRLLLTNSLSMQSRVKPSCAVVSHVISFARSLLSPRTVHFTYWYVGLDAVISVVGWSSSFPVSFLFD